MSKQLADTFRAHIMPMAYSSNEGSQHELNVVEALVHGGFKDLLGTVKVSQPALKRFVANKSEYAGLPDIPCGSFIWQPGGSQCPPDILLRDTCGRFVAIECKCTKSAAPSWNDSLPKSHVVYVFSSQKHNETTVFLGGDIVAGVMSPLVESLFAEVRSTIDTINEHIKQNNEYGFFHYPRPKWCQGGGAELTDLFTHAKRNQNENNALAYLAE